MKAVKIWAAACAVVMALVIGDTGTAIAQGIPQVNGDSPYTPSEDEWVFSAMRKGGVQTTVTKNARGKVTAEVRETVTGITGDKEAFAIEYRSEMSQKEGKKLTVGTYRIVVRDGVMYIDLKEMMGSMVDLENKEIEIESTAIKIPADLVVGQTLDDARIEIKAGFVKASSEMTEGKVLAKERVTTPAGTFDCFKVSQKVRSSALGIKTEDTTLTWYAKGVGQVMSQTLDKRGNVKETSELVENR